MMKRKFDLRGLDYYLSGNVFAGNIQEFNYKIRPEGELLHAVVWYGPYCLEKSEMAAKAEFALSETGMKEMVDWLDVEYGKTSKK